MWGGPRSRCLVSGLQQEVTVQLASFHTTSRQFQGFSDVSHTTVHSSFGMPSGFLPGWGLKTNSASACGLYGYASPLLPYTTLSFPCWSLCRCGVPRGCHVLITGDARVLICHLRDVPLRKCHAFCFYGFCICVGGRGAMTRTYCMRFFS